ncbi:hypothetical protein WSK_3086 [Novosphingobium sp. Rr 2-17]|uniref:hypothetical protein n=1 Tax=Novosphingobium sp. Rr 2-17 TaxID=555793 RepID=UPI0002697BA9|nr:hypothetical protein [Novosphingobium sp. Rr 2-17]EIZ78341.1 hypothetical protein WSK_3086 [Novosphingobium sp. Rr 2-17]
MKKPEWFRAPSTGGLLLFPCSRQGWIVMLILILALLASIWLPPMISQPYRIGCLVVYLAVSYWAKAMDQ